MRMTVIFRQNLAVTGLRMRDSVKHKNTMAGICNYEKILPEA